MTTPTTTSPPQAAPFSHADNSRHDPAPRARPVVLRLEPEHLRTIHRSIPILVGEARRQLASRGPGDVREVVLDLSAIPPTPVAAPLLLLVRLLRRLADADGSVEVVGVSPALAAALIPFELPAGVALTDTSRRRWAN